MERIILFFCDIYGTFDEGNGLKINQDEIIRFARNLERIRKVNGSDKVVFSFVTSENVDVVLSMEDKLIMGTETENISIGKHFCIDGCTTSVNKPLSILNYIKSLEESYIIDSVYYADDCEFYHYFLDNLKTFFDVTNYIHSIIPKEHGILEVNDTLEDIVISCNLQKIK